MLTSEDSLVICHLTGKVCRLPFHFILILTSFVSSCVKALIFHLAAVRIRSLTIWCVHSLTASSAKIIEWALACHSWLRGIYRSLYGMIPGLVYRTLAWYILIPRVVCRWHSTHDSMCHSRWDEHRPLMNMQMTCHWAGFTTSSAVNVYIW